MTLARRDQVKLCATSYYHCVTRCVRRAFLCGKDRESGRSFDHRKCWIANRLKHLASIFAIDLCAYAIMSNHYHVVVRVNQAGALRWSDEEVAGRWMRLFHGHPLVDRYLKGHGLSSAEQRQVIVILRHWRTRLYDLSWFMRCVNEPIARSANREDDCRGRFWEGRFKCQALLDEAALLACMAYVDLNPVRAGVSITLEGSDHTSIQDRMRAWSGRRGTRPGTASGIASAAGLLAFEDEGKTVRGSGLPFGLLSYLELLEWTGRAVRDGKPGYIPAHIVPVLERLKIDKREWVGSVCHLGRRFHRVIGTVERIHQYSRQAGRRWLKGLSASRLLYEPLYG